MRNFVIDGIEAIDVQRYKLIIIELLQNTKIEDSFPALERLWVSLKVSQNIELTINVSPFPLHSYVIQTNDNKLELMSR